MLPDPIEIIRKDTLGLVGWACPLCGTMWTGRTHPCNQKETKEEQDAAAKHEATYCCHHHCQRCDAELPVDEKYWLICKKCRTEDEQAKEQQRYQAAEKILEDDYDGWICWPDHDSHNNGFFESVDELRDWCAQNDVALPDYVYACTESKVPQLDAQDIIEQELESQEAYEDAIYDVDVDGLQDLLDGWLEHNLLTCYQDNPSRLVLLSNARTAEWQKERDEDDRKWEAEQKAREAREAVNG